MPITINRLKGAFTVYFTTEKIENYEQAENTDGEMFGKFFKLMLHQGINLAPSKYEAWFLTIAHTEEDIKNTLNAVEMHFKNINELNIHIFTHPRKKQIFRGFLLTSYQENVSKYLTNLKIISIFQF